MWLIHILRINYATGSAGKVNRNWIILEVIVATDEYRKH